MQILRRESYTILNAVARLNSDFASHQQFQV